MNSHPSPAGPPPSPELFFRTANAYQQTAALKAAVELDIFTAIADGDTTADEIARARAASPRGVRILCDYLCVLGFLTKTDAGYSLTPDSALFLNRNSPAYMGGTLDFMLSPHITGNFADVAALVRNGGSTREDGATIAPDNPIWVTFARSMMPMMAMAAQNIAQIINGDSTQPLKVLDIAAGHGLFGIAFAKLNPNAHIVAQDWTGVLEVACENAGKAGVAARYSTIPGSAFEVDFGNGYDLILLTNFFHHFDVETCEQLAKRVHSALAKGGRALTLDFVPNDDRISPPMAAGFAMTMLAGTPGGDVYTLKEYEEIFARAGFSRSEEATLPGSPETLIVSYK